MSEYRDEDFIDVEELGADAPGERGAEAALRTDTAPHTDTASRAEETGSADIPAENASADTKTDDYRSGNGSDRTGNASGGDGKPIHVCAFCGRSEKLTGPMFHLPGNLSVCDDCMHKMMDEVTAQSIQIFGPDGLGGAADAARGFGGAESPSDTAQDGKMGEAPNGNDAAQGEGAGKAPNENGDAQGDKEAGTPNGGNVPQTGDSGSASAETDGKPRRVHPNVSFINLADIMNMGFEGAIAGRQRGKQKKKEKRPDAVFSIEHVPAPHKIKETDRKSVV